MREISALAATQSPDSSTHAAEPRAGAVQPPSTNTPRNIPVQSALQMTPGHRVAHHDAEQAAKQGQKPVNPARTKKPLDLDDDETIAQAEGDAQADQPVTAHGLTTEPPVLYAQASTGTGVVTDAGPGSGSTTATPASTTSIATAVPATTVSVMDGSGMLALGGLAVVGMAAAARNGGSPAPTPAADSTPPTLDISMAGTPQHGQTVVFTFSFNEDVTGFAANRIELSGGTAGNFVAVNARTYTLAVTVGSSGQPLTVGVAPGAASDLAGNAYAEGQVYETSTIAPPVEPPAFDTTPPSFTAGASATANAVENATGPVHTASATDNVGVTAYAFAGGADDGKFNLDPATGALAFKVAPDFEVPGSVAGSNAYTVKVKAVDAAGNEAVQTITVNVTDVDEVPPLAPTLMLANDTNTAGDFLTRDGTIQVSGLELGATWAYSTNGGGSWQAGNGGAAATGTTGSFVLPNGTYANGSILVRQTDAAGHTSPTGGLEHPLYQPIQRLDSLAAGEAWGGPALAVLNDGSYVVVWETGTPDDQGGDLLVQRFNANGSTQGVAQRLQGSSMWEEAPQITALSDGGYVVTWYGGTSDGQGSDIFVQRYAANNSAVGGVQRLQGMPGNLSDDNFETTALANGGYVVAWRGETSDGQGWDIFVKHYSANNTAVGDVVRLQGMAGASSESNPLITPLTDGGYVVTWMDYTTDGQNWDIFAQRHAADGSTVGSLQRLQGAAGNRDDRDHQTTALNDGGYVITWSGYTSDDQGYDIFVQRYAANNVKLGGLQRLQGMSGDLWDYSPQTTALSDGGYVITWRGETSDGQGSDIFVQRYAADNSAVGDVLRLQDMSGDWSSHQRQTTALNEGAYVITWRGFTSDGQGSDIFVQQFGSDNSAAGSLQRLQGMAGELEDMSPQTVVLVGGAYVVMWTGVTSDGQAEDVFFQRFEATGNKAGGVQRLQGELEGDRMDVLPRITALPDGGFVATWTNGYYDPGADAVFVVRYDAQGQVVQNPGAPLVVDTVDPAFANGSHQAVSVFETDPNNIDTTYTGVYDAQATANGGADEAPDLGVVYRLSGTDAALFNINSKTGRIGFKTAPDTTAPQDSGANNVYDLTVTAEDKGGNTATQSLAVTVQPVLRADTRLQGMAGNLADESPQTTALSDGGHVITWQGISNDGQSYDIFMQRYAANNSAVGGVQRLQGMAGSLWDNYPQTTALNDGGYVITWRGETSDGQGSDIFVQRYAANNSAVGGVQRLQGMAGNLADESPQTTALSDGGYAITWHGETSDGKGRDIFVQRYAANNSAVGGVQRLQGMAGNGWDQYPQTTALSDGGYVITWQGISNDGQSYDIFVQRYAANNSAMGGVQRLQGMAGDLWDESPQSTALSDGGYVITWTGMTSDGQDNDIFVQRYAANNSAVGGVQRLQGMAGSLWDSSPQTTALNDGGYVITWDGVTNDGQGYDVFVQRYAADNSAVGGMQRLKGTPGYRHDSDPQVAALADGGYVLVWQDFDICLQRFAADNTLVGGVQHMTGSAGVHSDSSPQVTALNDGGFTVTWHGETPDGQGLDIFVQRFDAQGQPVAEPLTSAQTFALWQEAADAHGGDTSKDINALNQHSADIVNQRDTTSRDGSANQADPAKRLTEYVDQVTGTDIVSAAEFNAGFTLTGKAAAGQAGTIQFWLDKDRTNGINEVGVQLQHGQEGVSIAYDNATGEYSISFAAGSTALQQATHNTYGSGVHQITVDTDGNGAKNSSEASRLFLVASGMAQTTDTGLVSQNYSVQDRVTNDVFVYYYGDPDGAGIGLWTRLDNGDTASNWGQVTTDKDGSNIYQINGDEDYFNNPTDNTNAATTPATATNTALHFVTDIAAQTWEFHIGLINGYVELSDAIVQATDHTIFGSNSSRQASLAEAVALYAANFGGDNAGGNTVGAVQPMSNAGSTNDYTAAEDNCPGNWGDFLWTAASTPLGYAQADFQNGLIYDGQVVTDTLYGSNSAAVL